MSNRKVYELNAPLVHLDYTRSLVDDADMAALCELAEASGLAAKLAQMNAGEKINSTEGRAVEHVQLRSANARAEIVNERKRMLEFAEQIYTGQATGATGKPIVSLVHIGIGGSYLGPRLLYEAFERSSIECRFVANVDPAAMVDALDGLDPETTLIVSVSKSGTTAETLSNARTALAWIDESLGEGCGVKQLAVVSANPDGGRMLDCPSNRCFAMWDSIGGRYSVWSAVSLAVAAACGPESFSEFLEGAATMDQHVSNAEGFDNVSVALALLRVFHSTALESQTHCVISYQHRLRSLPGYLQQLVMESNGKSVTAAGRHVSHKTSSVWWGGEGTNDQHSYFQLLLQGGQPTPGDFIYARRPRDGESATLHNQLVAHCLGQSRALFSGIDEQSCLANLIAAGVSEDEARRLAPHQAVKGGQPINLISIEKLTPASVGALLAMYEHMTAFLGWMWEVNSFDQWGVEFGKMNFRKVLKGIEEGSAADFDPATATALKRQNI